MSPTTLDAVGAVLTVADLTQKTHKLVTAYFGKDDQALAQLFAEGDRLFLVDFVQKLDRRVRLLEEGGQAEATVSVDPAGKRLVNSLRWEAAREATDERRGMLASLAAELAVSERSVEDKARAERTLRDLDPEDVRELARIAEHEQTTLRRDSRYDLWKRYPRRAALAVCVDINYEALAGAGGAGRPHLEISYTGTLVLEALASFIDGTDGADAQK